IVTVGPYSLLEEFGTYDGEYAHDPTADSLIVFTDAPLLRCCYLLDFPGYEDNATDEQRIEQVLREADVIFYLSNTTGFMSQSDIARLGPTIECLPSLEKRSSDFPTLGHLMIVASHAYYSQVTDEDLAVIKRKAAFRIERALGETRLKNRSSE